MKGAAVAAWMYAASLKVDTCQGSWLVLVLVLSDIESAEVETPNSD